MIRRGFWVVTGAVLGVSGYRRVTRLASMIGMSKSRPGPGSAAGPRMLALTPGRALVQTTPRRAAVGSEARGSEARGSLARSSGARTHIARAVAAAGFLRDVRDGMAEYWDLHRGQPDPVRTGHTLGAQALEMQALETRGDRASSGIRQQGRREP